ncbi:MAG: sigma-70 family RNA polymerase sigma factor [Lachnospiraceae bacterium]|nr:sigma-70 family RNA polymerase sigma factor [Lachnospiraceae bacterium]MBR3761803.1 sigma-70 family RNA polymerase sigma factor [Lachnospiraceae bacterium]
MKDIYKALSDEELLARYMDGDTAVVDFLMDKYKYLVRQQAGNMFLLGADHEDLLQEGMIGLFKAIRDYDPGRDTSFQTFARLCISRQIFTAIEASNRHKHAPLNSYTSLSETDSEQYKEIRDRLIEVTAIESPESMLIDKENVDQLEKILTAELSVLEKQVLDLYFIGMSTREIAAILGRTEKATDNALQRMKGKLRKVFGKEESADK